MTMAQSMDKLHRNKEQGVGKGNMFQIHPSQVQEKEGFNPRNYDDPETVAHIRQLADAYKAGAYVPPITVQVIDGIVYVVEGHCRRRAMLLAISEGTDLGLQPVHEFKGDAFDAEVFVVTSQNGKKLAPTELAQMYSRMSNRGKTEAEIAQSVGKTVPHVSQHLALHRMPMEIKQLIDSKVVSMTLAMETFNDMGTAAVDVLAEGVEVSLKAGKKKLTKKALVAQQDKQGTTAAKRRLTKKVIAQVSDHVALWGPKFEGVEYDESDMATLQLSKEEIQALVALRELLAPTGNAASEQQEDETGAEEEGAYPTEGALASR